MKSSKSIARIVATAAVLFGAAAFPRLALAAEAPAGESVAAPGGLAATSPSHGTTHHVRKGGAVNGKKHISGRGAHAPQAHHSKKPATKRAADKA